MEASEWLALAGAVLGLLLPALAFAVMWGRLLARLDAQDRLLSRVEGKLDHLAGPDLGELEERQTRIEEKLHALRGNFQLLIDRFDQFSKNG